MLVSFSRRKERVICQMSQPTLQNLQIRNEGCGNYACLDLLYSFRGVDKELHVPLKQIKTLYCDPIEHPEVVLTGPEAISLLGVVQRAISRTLTLIKSTVS